jgi:curli biogenesis system outer membrane secretion channel CsgG
MWMTVILILVGSVSHGLAQEKKRVAVLDFDYATVRGAAAAYFGTDVDLGKGIATLVIDNLVSAGVYSVVERAALDKVLMEQNFSNSDRANPATAANLGRILGVDAIVIGGITQFDSATGNAGRIGTGLRAFGVSRTQNKAVISVSARVVSTDTAEILVVAGGKGEASRSETSVAGAGRAVDFGSTAFKGTVVGEAVSRAAEALSVDLNGKAKSLPSTVRAVEGLVADVSGTTLVLNIGTRAGVKVGSRLDIRRQAREIRDPATGVVLRRITEAVGEVLITEADETSSVGTFTGASAAKVGDTVASRP